VQGELMPWLLLLLQDFPPVINMGLPNSLWVGGGSVGGVYEELVVSILNL